MAIETQDVLTMITIVVPVYNDPEGIATTLESLLTQTTGDYSIAVVDNDSTDRTPEVVRSYEKDHDHLTLYHETEIQSSYAARNIGIRNTDNDILAFFDADMTVSDGWLDRVLNEFRDVDYLGCNVELTLPEDTLVGRYNVRTGFPVKQYLEEQHYAPTCALLVRRGVFEDVGSFDSRLISGGDREFGERVHEAGYEQGYAEDAVVYHPARTSFNSLAKKNIRIGRGFCQKQQYYPERYGKPGIPPRPSGPSGKNEDELDTVTTRLAFACLSIVMLACRGIGYYYEFVFGERRDDIPGPTS